MIICWSNKPSIFHKAARLGSENMQPSINWLIDWMRLDTALKILDPPLPSHTFGLPQPCHHLHAPRGQVAGGPRRTCSSEGSSTHLQGMCWCSPSPAVPRRASRGASWAARTWRPPAPGTGAKRIRNVKPPLAHEISDGDTAFKHGVGLWPSQIDRMNKPAGRGFFPRL